MTKEEIMPKVSVIMGVYNREHRLTRGVESILNQTFRDFEFIICDDASTDGSYALLEELRSKDDRIVLIKNDRNMGLANTLNNCLKIAKGEYIARMDDDDYAHPIRFEKQVEFLDKRDEYAIVGSSMNMYDDEGIWGGRTLRNPVTALDLYKGRSFFHPTVMIRKEALCRVNNYTVERYTRLMEDIDLWIKLYHAGYKGYVLGDVLLDYFEDKLKFKRAKFEYRIGQYNLIKRARKLLNIPNRYRIFELRPLIIGLVPNGMMRWYRRVKFRKI
jgi:glycosyltransferase EpsE